MNSAAIKDLGSRRLKNGETMTVKVMEPPLQAPYTGYDRLYWWPDVRDKVLAGEYAESSMDRCFVGEIGGEFAGSVVCNAPARTKELGLVEFVWTEPKHRRKGIMTHLLDALIEDFGHEGGKMLHLCTSNPAAAALYRNAGFVHHIGDGMRYLYPGNEAFDEVYLAYGGPATIMEGAYGDMASWAALYNNPGLDWFVRYYIPWFERRVFDGFRFEGQYRKLVADAENGAGQVLVLENAAGRVVAGASLSEVPSYYEQHVKVLNLACAPAYFAELDGLIEAIVTRAEKDGTEIVDAYVVDSEAGKKEVLERVGFREGARLRGHIKLEGGENADFVIYTRELQPARLHKKGHGEYYGGRSDDIAG